MPRRVVITGLGVVTALGNTLERYWSGLLEGRSGVGPLTLFDPSPFKVRFGGQVPAWDGDELFGHKEARRLDRFAQFALAAGLSAVTDAGLDFSAYDPYSSGVMIGSGIGGLHEFEEQHRNLLEKGASRISPFMIPKLMVNAASGQVSIRFGLKGPTSAVATACASAANAIGDAFRMIRAGHADIMISGGSEAAITPMGLGGFASMRALSTRNDDPQRASRPFDRDRDGFVLAEGAGILILEEAEVARKRGARIYAELVGYGMSADGSHITAPDEEGRGAGRAMSECLKDARTAPDAVGYINAHGTSTPLGDRAEVLAVKALFGPAARKVAMSSTKSMTGHTLGGAGAIESVATVLALRDSVLPPTINLENPDEGFDLNFVPNKAQEVKIQYAINNSFGFGGHNTSTIFARWDG